MVKDEETAQKSLRLGAKAYILKPFKSKDVLDTINELML